MKKTRQKAFAYITHQKRLLVFRHVALPEAGIQVPAGTIKANECPEQAVLREAVEETGLTDLTVGRFLGEQEREMSDFGRDEIHHRFFYRDHAEFCVNGMLNRLGSVQFHKIRDGVLLSPSLQRSSSLHMAL